MLDIRKYLFRLKDDGEEVFGVGILYLSTIGALFEAVKLGVSIGTGYPYLEPGTVTDVIGSDSHMFATANCPDQDQEMNKSVLKSTDPDHQSEDLLKTLRSYSRTISEVEELADNRNSMLVI
ncbi:hypothetical protein OSB04_006545 [Centaurea solstitialis]|uniref:Uncharacterized protein n=1 Tax=Centaurea solstitialis TaxID=347529 RepID=A0AA38TUU0_9ASTR|nr:hypothetical protein OSB04_006545 [Centaurea solstitialis]